MLYFRLPDQTEIFTVKAVDNTAAVTFYPFTDGYTAMFSGEIVPVAVDDLINLQPETSDDNRQTSISKEQYLATVRKVIDFVRNEHLPKLVFARRKIIDFEGRELSVVDSFLQLCNDYPGAFVYCFEQKGVSWIGATPELLGSFHKSTRTFTTMSLAGTLPQDEEWTQKEIDEQQPVTDYIRNILEAHATEISVSETYSQPSGSIKHLRTDFSAKISPDDLEEIIKELHPTPAVCGIPKKLCKDAISEFEGQSRELYAGYIRVETRENIYFFVNLRCARLFRDKAVLFAGGGITAASDPEKEWRETELKSDAVGRRLIFS
ncbi:MAG: hypothetical protein EAS48_06870 [Chryseobacterium sp.]|nr:MAG: hypothetical protein EAS48_06870 [Chryseobacterium sp.]